MTNFWTYTLLGCLIATVITACLLGYQASTLKALNASLTKEFAQKEQMYQFEISKAQTALQAQNKAIEIYQADLHKIENTILEKTQQLNTLRIEHENKILEELAKDSSSENQLSIINRMLHGFAKN